MRFAHATSLGPRQHQADVADGNDHVWIVCDGVGARYDAVTAAQLTTSVVLGKAPWPSPRAALEAARDALNAEWPEDYLGGDTVAVAATVAPKRGFDIAWVGDCRAYALPIGSRTVQQVTRDDNEAQRLRDVGYPVSLKHHSNNVVLSTVREGRINRIRVDGVARLLLCSDGLYKALPGEWIARGLTEFDRADITVNQLMAAAESRGLKDNTALLVIDA